MGAEFLVLKTGPHVSFSINPRKGGMRADSSTRGSSVTAAEEEGKRNPKRQRREKSIVVVHRPSSQVLPIFSTSLG